VRLRQPAGVPLAGSLMAQQRMPFTPVHTSPVHAGHDKHGHRRYTQARRAAASVRVHAPRPAQCRAAALPEDGARAAVLASPDGPGVARAAPEGGSPSPGGPPERPGGAALRRTRCPAARRALRRPAGACSCAGRASRRRPRGRGAGGVAGSVFLIIGSTVGAGVLALPAVTQPIGAAPSSAVLVAVWALLTLEALLLVDINLAVRRAPHPTLLNSCDRQRAPPPPHAAARRAARAAAHGARAARAQGGAAGGRARGAGVDARDGGRDAGPGRRERGQRDLPGAVLRAADRLQRQGRRPDRAHGRRGAAGGRPGGALGRLLRPHLRRRRARGGVGQRGAHQAAAAAVRRHPGRHGRARGLGHAGGDRRLGRRAARDQRRVPVAGARAAPRRPIGGASARARAAPERAPPRQVYHDLVPVICRLLDGDRPRITRAVLAGARPMRPARARPAATGARQAAARLRAAGHRVAGCGRARSATVPARPPPRARAAGSAVPLAMFLAFNAATLAVPAPAGDPLAHLLRTGGPALGAAVAVFSLFAICTSFACTAIGAPPRRRPAAPSSRSMRRAHGRAPQACRRRWRARRTPCARPPGAARAARPPRTRPGSARRCSRWRSGRRWRSAWRTRAPSWRCSRRAAAPGSSCDGRRAARAACARSRTGAGCLPCGVGWPGFSGLWVRWWSRRMAVPWERAPCMLWTCGRGGGVRLHQA